MKTRREFVQSALLGAAAVAAAPTLLQRAGAAPLTNDGGNGTLIAGGVAPAGTIDWHNHWITPRQIEILKKRTTGPRLEKNVDGQFALVSGSASGAASHLPLVVGFTDIDARLQHMNQTGVQRQVISWATTTGYDALLTPDEAKPLWTAFNEDLADLVRKHPNRFSGYAVVPTSDIDWAAKELDRAYRDLGLIGVVLPVGALQTREGARRLTPIFEVSQKHRGVVYVHSGPAYHTIPGQTTLHTPPDDVPGVRYDYEWATTYARGVITLTQTGFLDPYPDVTVQIAMLGGLTPWLAAISRTGPPADGSPDPVARLRRVYLDASISRAEPSLDLAVRAFGGDRILFGSDFPIVTVDKTVAAIHRAALSTDEKRRVFVDNGRTLFAAVGKAA